MASSLAMQKGAPSRRGRSSHDAISLSDESVSQSSKPDQEPDIGSETSFPRSVSCLVVSESVVHA